MENLYYDIVTEERQLNKEQKNILLNEFTELHPYLKNCYLMYVTNPDTNHIDTNIVFQFDESKHLNLSSLSDETKNTWDLNNLQFLMDKSQEEFWNHGCIMYRGIPPIKRLISDDLLEKLNIEWINRI